MLLMTSGLGLFIVGLSSATGYMTLYRTGGQLEVKHPIMSWAEYSHWTRSSSNRWARKISMLWKIRVDLSCSGVRSSQVLEIG